MSFKHFTLSLLGAVALAAPTSLGPRLSLDAAIVNDNIQGWQDDIANVNNFLIIASTLAPAQLAEEASQLLLTTPGDVGDEPNRLQVLTGLIAVDNKPAMSAATQLGQIFGGVLGNLTIIVNDNGDAAAVAGAVEQINCLRCNFVLPDIDLVYSGAVSNNPGSTGATTAGPNVCPQPAPGSFTCS